MMMINRDTSNVTGTTEIISKSLRKYLSNVTGKHKIQDVQTTIVLGTAHIYWKVQM